VCYGLGSGRVWVLEEEREKEQKQIGTHQKSIRVEQKEVFIMPHRFLPESGHSSGFWWNLEEFKMAERPAKITIPGVTYSGGIRPFQN